MGTAPAILVIILSLALKSAQSVDLTCSFNTQSPSYAGDIRVCTASGIAIDDPDITITSVNGKTLNDTNNFFYDNNGNYFKIDNVKGVEFESKQINYLPKGLDKFFPAITYLRIFNSQLQSIVKSDLEPFPNLLVLDLSHNQLEILESDVFHGNQKLKYVILDNNNLLKYVGKEIFAFLTNLENIQFQNCGCVSVYSSGYGMSTAKEHIKNGCLSPDAMIAKFCQKDLNIVKNENESLKKHVESLEEEMSVLKSRTESLYSSCNGNLNAATKNLFIASKKLENYELISPRSTEVIENQQKVNVTVECDSFGEFCHATDFEVKFSSMTVDEVIKKNAAKIIPENVSEFVIKEQQTLFLPFKIGEKFPNLSKLSVINSGLFELNIKIFENLSNLTTLTVTHNKIIEIPVNTFEGLPQLRTLDLSSNNIEKLDAGVFKNLVNLLNMNLKQNKLITINIEVFENLKNLEKLNIQENQIKFISANLLSTLVNLKEIDFADNECINMSHPEHTKENIETSIIDSCIAPIKLNCSFEILSIDSSTKAPNGETCQAQELKVDYPKTKISEIIASGKSEFDTYKVTILTISGQSIKFFPFHLGKSLPNLNKIVVEKSKLTSLQKDDFLDFVALKTIEIRFNNITAIEADTFGDLNQLEYLDLSSNSIQTLPAKIFVNLINLKTLILSENSIAKLTADILPRKNSIDIFKVDKNELEMIETKILRFLRKASIIDLSENICIDLKYDKSDGGSKRLVELSGEIDLNCSSDD